MATWGNVSWLFQQLASACFALVCKLRLQKDNIMAHRNFIWHVLTELYINSLTVTLSIIICASWVWLQIKLMCTSHIQYVSIEIDRKNPKGSHGSYSKAWFIVLPSASHSYTTPLYCAILLQLFCRAMFLFYSNMLFICLFSSFLMLFVDQWFQNLMAHSSIPNQRSGKFSFRI